MGFTSVPFKNTVLLAKSVSIRWLSVRHYLSWRQKMRVVLNVVNGLEKSRFVAFSVDSQFGSMKTAIPDVYHGLPSYWLGVESRTTSVTNTKRLTCLS